MVELNEKRASFRYFVLFFSDFSSVISRDRLLNCGLYLKWLAKGAGRRRQGRKNVTRLRKRNATKVKR